MILRRVFSAGTLSLLSLAVSSLCPAFAQGAQTAAPQGQAPGQNQQQPISNSAAVEATDGRYVPANGTIDGSSIKQFLNSGPEINATQMEEASIPADNLMQMPAYVDNKADARAQKEAAAEAQGQGQSQATSGSQGHKKKKQKQRTFFSTLTQPMVSTLNFLGFPVGLNDDVGIDASLSSDLPESVRKRDGAYNPNVAPSVEATTNKYFGQ
ncbi:MAG: hypothetical protein JSS83_05575 [Cyanobacteria bacterium SZAS LIN-3]|nr:hypothetical protein [Cyanobacteria bacterium SZAS LIN-3]